MKSTFKANQNRNRFGHKRTHCGRSLTKEMMDNIANWEFLCNNNYQMQDHSLDSLNPEVKTAFPEDVEMSDIDTNESIICRMNVWLKNADSQNGCNFNEKNSLMRRTKFYEEKGKYIPLYPTTIWSDNEDLANENWSNYSEKIVETNPVSDNPKPSPLEVEECAIREEYQLSVKRGTECAIKEEYDRPYELCCLESVDNVGGQWDINSNETAVQIGETLNVNPAQMESDVFSFGLVSSDNLKRQDDDFTRQNDTNNALEELSRRRLVAAVMCKSCENEDLWSSGAVSKMNLNSLFDEKTISLMIVNHSMDNSAFCEYRRPVEMTTDDLRPTTPSHSFSRSMKKPLPLTHKTSSFIMQPIFPSQMSEEQKSTSPHMFFEPIKPLPTVKGSKEGRKNSLQDGTTFNIEATPDEVKFQRSATGSLVLETELGEFRKYFEYHWQPPSDEVSKSASTRKSSEGEEFSIKFWVSPNDKSCQTVDDPPTQSAIYVEDVEDRGKQLAGKDKACNWLSQNHTDIAAVKKEAPERPNSLCEADDVIWGYAPKSSNVFCKYCHGKHPWPNSSLKKLDVDWDERSLKNIWGGTETCGTCPWSTKVPTPLVETTTKLREESKEEAERLLSDLSSLQLSYSAKLLENQFTSDEGPREKKRRHSYMSIDSDLWSFATRLQEDCLISLSTLPTRRSVTL